MMLTNSTSLRCSCTWTLGTKRRIKRLSKYYSRFSERPLTWGAWVPWQPAQSFLISERLERTVFRVYQFPLQLTIWGIVKGFPTEIKECLVNLGPLRWTSAKAINAANLCVHFVSKKSHHQLQQLTSHAWYRQWPQGDRDDRELSMVLGGLTELAALNVWPGIA